MVVLDKPPVKLLHILQSTPPHRLDLGSSDPGVSAGRRVGTPGSKSGMKALGVLLGLAAALASAKPGLAGELLELSLEELMSLQIRPAGSLTTSSARLGPSTVTTITQEDIQASGARSLNELLDIYVPNLQMIRHHWEARHLGLRGIINDREEKYLLVVNGRVMNERTHYGVLGERDLPLLGDIHHIDVVRGPGSATYGAGAVSMVVDIVTDTAQTFTGTELTGRLGAVEEFQSAEIKHGRRFGEDSGLLLYVGIDHYRGADQDDAPLVYGVDFDDFWGTPVSGGQSFGQPINRDGESYQNRYRLKAHAQYTGGGWNLWARYTRGGEQFEFAQDNLARAPHGWLDEWAVTQYPSYESLHQPGTGYQQMTVDASHRKPLSDHLTITTTFGFNRFDYERASFDSPVNPYWNLNHREEAYLARILANWTPSDRHQVAIGAEWSHERFGLRNPDAPGERAVLAPYVQPPYNGISPQWDTDTRSLFGEHQWKIDERWTHFTSVRLDKNTYTDWLFSPRLTTVYAPDDMNTWKLMLAKSLRMTFAEEMRWQWEHGKQTSSPEELKSAELRYERQQSPNLLLAGSVFYHDLDVIAWDSGEYGVEFDSGTTQVGTLQQWGAELELRYKKKPWRVLLSHGYTKLLNFERNQDADTVLTAEPYGYGDDLANWSNHVTKLVVGYDLDDRWRLDGSARVYWGYPGAEDFARFVTDNQSPIAIAPGYDDPYGPSAFVNLGLQYKAADHLTVRVDSYNLLGWFDDTLNKRLYGFNSYGDYRVQAPAFGISVRYLFK